MWMRTWSIIGLHVTNDVDQDSLLVDSLLPVVWITWSIVGLRVNDHVDHAVRVVCMCGARERGARAWYAFFTVRACVGACVCVCHDMVYWRTACYS
jgi:hypothetical protein